MIFMLDNYDSFTYNLVQYMGELGAEMEVARNDKTTTEAVLASKPAGIVISPGPCTPNEAGISNELIAAGGRQDTRCLASVLATSALAKCSAAT